MLTSASYCYFLDKRQLEALEIWIGRRMLKIRWKDKVANVFVLGTFRIEVLKREIIDTRTEDKAFLGRKRLHVMSDLAPSKYLEVKSAAED